MNSIPDKLDRSIDWLGNKFGLNLQYLIKNGNWVSLRFLILGLTGFLVSYFFAKFGSKELLGHYQLVLSIISLVSIFSFAGLNAAALEAVVKGRDAGVLRTVKLSFLLSLIGVPILLGIGIYYLYKNEWLLGETLMLSALLFPAFCALNTWSVYYEGKLLFNAASVRSILLNLVLSGVLIIGIILHLNALALVLLYLLVNIIGQGIFVREISQKITDYKNDAIDTKFGISVSIQKFVSGLSTSLPPLVISSYFGVELLAVYYIGYYVISALSSFLDNLISLYTPILFGKLKFDHWKIIFNNIFVGTVVWVIFILFLNYFFLMIYGATYRSSLNLAYNISGLLILSPLHKYLVSFFSTRKKNNFLIFIFCVANLAGLLAVWITKQHGFQLSVPTYLYVLEIITVLPLLGVYISNIGQKKPSD